jgi:hypothetical protein
LLVGIFGSEGMDGFEKVSKLLLKDGKEALFLMSPCLSI